MKQRGGKGKEGAADILNLLATSWKDQDQNILYDRGKLFQFNRDYETNEKYSGWIKFSAGKVEIFPEKSNRVPSS